MQQYNKDLLPTSNNRYAKVFAQQQATSKQFSLENFYSHQKLNLQELKRRISKHKNKLHHTQLLINSIPQNGTSAVKKNKINSKVVNTSIKMGNNSNKDIRMSNKQVNTSHKSVNTSQNAVKVNNVSANASIKVIKDKTNTKPQFFQINHKQIQNLISKKLKTENNQQDRQNKVYKAQKINFNNKRMRIYTTGQQQSPKSPQLSPSNQQPSVQRYKSYNPSALARMRTSKISSKGIQSTVRFRNKALINQMGSSNCTSNKVSRNWQAVQLQNTLVIDQKVLLDEYQQELNVLWQHYQLMSLILMGIKNDIQSQKKNMFSYRKCVCSDHFEFISVWFKDLLIGSTSANKNAFVSKIKRAIVQAKLLQNAAMVLLSMWMAMGKDKGDANLVNLVGYASSNVIFIINLLELTHIIKSPLELQSVTQGILKTISEFQMSSYGQKLKKIGQIVFRLQQNNEVMGMVLGKVLASMDSQFQQTIQSYLKQADKQAIPLFQYSKYLFEFLSFTVCQNNLQGFKDIQIAPAPYLSVLPKAKTIVIQPWQVLVAVKQGKLYFRANSSRFLAVLSQHWNIVYWSDLMPDMLNPLIKELPQAFTLYKYHCKKENGRLIKQLQRIGSDIDNTIIIDRNFGNFKYNRAMGLQLPWLGQKKDTKLLTLVELLTPLGLSNKKLKDSFDSVQSLMGALRPSQSISKSKKRPNSTYISGRMRLKTHQTQSVQ